MGDPLGFMYLAKRKCGKVSAASWDDPDWDDLDKRQTLAEWEERGDTVERVEQFKGAPMPDWICDEPRDCQSCAGR